MKTKVLVIIIAIVVGAIFLLSNKSASEIGSTQSNVSIVDGTQVIEINAKGGYSPEVTSAAANVPTLLRVTTRATFDCSSALSIPKLGYRASLPPSGVTEIEVPAQQAGSRIEGLCSMGMYNFEISFI